MNGKTYARTVSEEKTVTIKQFEGIFQENPVFFSGHLHLMIDIKTEVKMIHKIGVIGVGHMAHYLLTGFARAGQSFEFVLADPDMDKASRTCREFDRHFQCVATRENQDAVDRSELIVLAVRPDALDTALSGLVFKPGHLVASVVAGASLKILGPLVFPAEPIRVLPVSCVAINQSPVLVCPENQCVQEVFSLLGQVHLLTDENCFAPGTALVGAFYAWMIALMDETSAWTQSKGIDPAMARQLVIETIEGACGMARHQEDKGLKEIWDTLATPGGISEHGAKILTQKGGLTAWSDALESVTQKMVSG